MKDIFLIQIESINWRTQSNHNYLIVSSLNSNDALNIVEGRGFICREIKHLTHVYSLEEAVSHVESIIEDYIKTRATNEKKEIHYDGYQISAVDVLTNIDVIFIIHTKEVAVARKIVNFPFWKKNYVKPIHLEHKIESYNSFLKKLSSFINL